MLSEATSLSTDVDGLMANPADFEGAACTFIRNLEGFDGVNLSTTLEHAPMQMRKEMPLQVVVSMFQKLVGPGSYASASRMLTECDIRLKNLHYVLFTSMGRLTGLLTKRDVVRLLSQGFQHVNALSGNDYQQQRVESMEWGRFW